MIPPVRRRTTIKRVHLSPCFKCQVNAAHARLKAIKGKVRHSRDGQVPLHGEEPRVSCAGELLMHGRLVRWTTALLKLGLGLSVEKVTDPSHVSMMLVIGVSLSG